MVDVRKWIAGDSAFMTILTKFDMPILTVIWAMPEKFTSRHSIKLNTPVPSSQQEQREEAGCHLPLSRKAEPNSTGINSSGHAVPRQQPSYCRIYSLQYQKPQGPPALTIESKSSQVTLLDLNIIPIHRLINMRNHFPRCTAIGREYLGQKLITVCRFQKRAASFH